MLCTGNNQISLSVKNKQRTQSIQTEWPQYLFDLFYYMTGSWFTFPLWEEEEEDQPESSTTFVHAGLLCALQYGYLQ